MGVHMEQILTTGINAEDAAEIGGEIEEFVETIRNTDPGVMLSEFGDKILGFLPTLLTAVIVFALGYLVVRILMSLIAKAIARSKIDKTLHYFINMTIRITMLVFLIVTCLGILGIPLTPLVAALGTAGLALSFAVQDSLANVAGGIQLLFNRPFSVGNYIEAGGVAGTVKEIRLVYTLISTLDNRDIHVPNGDVAKSVIVNYSAEPVRRLDLEFAVRADADIRAAKKILSDTVAQTDLALTDPAPIIRVEGQTVTLIKIACLVWAKPGELFTLRDWMIETVRARFSEAGFDAYPAKSREAEK